MKKISFTRFVKFSTVLMIPLLLSACITSKAEEAGMGWKHNMPMEPEAGEWKALELPEGNTFKVDTPPANDSDITKAELDELHQMASQRNEEDIKLINHWAGGIVSPNTHWLAVTEQMVKKYNLSPPAAARVHTVVSGAIYTASTAVYNEKYRYLRPRPTDLDPTLQLPEGFKVPPHPAYPSGHSATAKAASTVLSYMFPHEKDVFEKMAADASISRLKAGIHFKSDIVAGEQQGKAVAEAIIEKMKDDHAPLQFMEAGHGPAGH
ncbi:MULTISPECIES: phosphatase PAP2 family protein [unclassified Paenibacillus]|uniref:phosphatase PAP2 family protein n=1 Tax=unclassified Paenibacillus TaxID=185978 RepID=UPI001AE3ED17|nr:MULTISPECIES: phosphatase PAP2 family protein [unclassified Paenibacillus]MBP1153874.1 hypothetical protein [Paenibacillus sp. PvP091]MBP1170741.1 hypothetical protein [Paenibacillus sp. PvR098]MBP2441769.1 hypothetical protein [Paenibacillus sp. PvP052]